MPRVIIRIGAKSRGIPDAADRSGGHLADVSGEPVWDAVVKYLRDKKVIRPPQLNRPRLVGVKGNPGIA